MLSLSLLILAIAVILAYYFGKKFAGPSKKILPLRVISREELSLADSANSSSIHYLSIVGHVFNVSAGRSYYGKGGSYSFFAGRDATRAFASGDFTEKGLLESAEGLEPAACLAIEKWRKFFMSHAKYEFLGYLEDSLYMNAATQTPKFAMLQLQECAGTGEIESIAARSKAFCNTEWDLRTNIRRVWCGDEDSSDMAPRKALFATHDGGLKEQCMCIPIQQLASRKDLLEYDGCDSRGLSCTFTEIPQH